MSITADQEGAPTLRERVYGELVEMITTGAIPHDGSIRESRMAELLGTSRLPVREAIQRLEAEGWLERRPRGIARLRIPQESDLDEVFDMRRLLEVEAVTLAVRRASLDDVARLRKLSEEGRAAAAAQDHVRAQEVNTLFHRELAALARHSVLSEFLETLDRKVHWIFSNVRVERFAEHDDIINALENRDVEAARAAILDHIEQSHELLKTKLQG